MIGPRITVHNEGALFSEARCSRIINDLADEAEDKTAEYAENQIQVRLGRVLKHPTGRYQAGIKTTRIGGDAVVGDGKSVYGPWLEGTGSRNDETRFKGYFTFRLVAQQADRKAGEITEDVLDRGMWRL